VEADGEAVRLIADALEQVEGLGPTGDADRILHAGPVDLFELLGERRQLDLAGQAQLLDDPDAYPS